jgi:hypothetical protein
VDTFTFVVLLKRAIVSEHEAVFREPPPLSSGGG